MNDVDAAALAELLSEHLGRRFRVVGRRQLAGGLSAETTRLDLAPPSPARPFAVVARRYPDRNPAAALAALTREEALLAFARGAGVPVARSFGCFEGTATHPTLVVAHVRGSRRFRAASARDRLHLARAAGQALGRAHRAVLPPALRAVLPAPASLLPDTLPLHPHPDVRRALDLLHARAEQTPASEARLLHGDFWPGNLLWRRDRLAAVLDWEEARPGDPLVDLAIARLDTVWVYGIEAAGALTAAWQATTGISLARLPLYDLRAALRAVDACDRWATAYPACGRPDLTGARLRAATLGSLGRALVAAHRRGL